MTKPEQQQLWVSLAASLGLLQCSIATKLKLNQWIQENRVLWVAAQPVTARDMRQNKARGAPKILLEFLIESPDIIMQMHAYSYWIGDSLCTQVRHTETGAASHNTKFLRTN